MTPGGRAASLVSDVWHFELHELGEDCVHRFALKDLPRKIHLLHCIAGYRRQRVRDENPINRRAADAVGELHDALKQDGFDGHGLEVCWSGCCSACLPT